mmetsp:Transcript_25027/g.34489  ORF Transcript_25027/g.34489 Transcript_25027/m.34489 type:complete len:202 (+) Transcript_25027:184-789(+)
MSKCFVTHFKIASLLFDLLSTSSNPNLRSSALRCAENPSSPVRAIIFCFSLKRFSLSHSRNFMTHSVPDIFGMLRSMKTTTKVRSFIIASASIPSRAANTGNPVFPSTLLCFFSTLAMSSTSNTAILLESAVYGFLTCSVTDLLTCFLRILSGRAEADSGVSKDLGADALTVICSCFILNSESHKFSSGGGSRISSAVSVR